MGSLSIRQQDILGNARYRLTGLSFLLGNIMEASRRDNDEPASSAFYGLQLMVDESIKDIDDVLLQADGGEDGG